MTPIIRIRISLRERGCDSESFGTRITGFGVTVERFEGLKFGGPKLEFGSFKGIFFKIECLEGFGVKI
jgi:hypothetical protein